MSITIRFFSIIAMVFGLMTSAYAVATGWFIGSQIGVTNTHNKAKTIQNMNGTTTLPPVIPSNTGGGARIFFGYNFNPYVALETGFTRYATSTYNVPTTVACNNPAIRESSLDLAGKGIMAIPTIGIGVFAKVGVARMRASQSGSLSSNNTNMITPCGTNNGNKGTSVSLRPLVGVGVSYDLTQNWVTDLSWTRVSSGGGIQSADFIALGISYHWVDKYCGQFLCGSSD